MSNPTPSRLHVKCDYCGAEMRKTNLKNKLQEFMAKNVPLKYRHETEGEPEPETESSSMASFVRALTEGTYKIKHDVNLAQEEILSKIKTQSGIRKQK